MYSGSTHPKSAFILHGKQVTIERNQVQDILIDVDKGAQHSLLLQPLFTQHAPPGHEQDVEVSCWMQLIFTTAIKDVNVTWSKVCNLLKRKHFNVVLQTNISPPKYIVSYDVHKLQPGTDEEDDVFDVSRGESAALQGKHLFHFMFLKTQIGQMKTVATEDS